jgi:ribonucleoside-diphosphate reductase alpha chain
MNKNFYYTNAILEEELKQRSIYSEELIDKISQNGGSLKGISEIPKDMQKIFVIASEISPEWHVKMQAAFQNNGVDSAVSKTINMLNNATVEDVNNAYMLAYKMKCKGITIYRDGSRQNQVLSTNSTSVSENNQTESKYVKPNKRKKRTPGITEDYFVGCGKLYITVNGDKDGLVETFSNLGGNGVCSGYSEGLSRMISLAMRSNIDPYEIVDQLQMVKCPNCKGKKIDAKSCPHAFSKAIETRLKELGINKQEKQIETIVVENVEECKHPKMIMQEGCNVCPDCGYSKCS